MTLTSPVKTARASAAPSNADSVTVSEHRASLTRFFVWPLMDAKQKMGRPESSSMAKPTMDPLGKPPVGPSPAWSVDMHANPAGCAAMDRISSAQVRRGQPSWCSRMACWRAAVSGSTSGMPLTWWPGRRCGFFFSSSSSNFVPVTSVAADLSTVRAGRCGSWKAAPAPSMSASKRRAIVVGCRRARASSAAPGARLTSLVSILAWAATSARVAVDSARNTAAIRRAGRADTLP